MTIKMAQDDTVAYFKINLQLFAEEETAEVENTESEEKTDSQNPVTEEKKETETNPSSEVEKTDTDNSDASESELTFSVPDGIEAPTQEFQNYVKEQGFSNEQAQGLVDFYVNKVLPQQQEALAAQNEQWVATSKEKFGDKGIATANKALSRYGSPELVELLKTTGLGNHPEMIAVFKAVGEKISESTAVTPAMKPPEKQLLYPNSKEMYD